MSTGPAVANMPPFPFGPIIQNPFSGYYYELLEQIGQGGFGEVHLANAYDPEWRPIGTFCLKMSLHQPSWNAEAFFGDLLRGDPRVIQLYESFVYSVQAGGAGRHHFVLVMEVAPGGNLADHLVKHGPWLEARAVRELSALLKVFERLHSAGILHRDLTPMNVLVGSRGCLKMADFGIARMSLRAGGVPAGPCNPGFATTGMVQQKHKHWTTRDDVYYLGLILSALLAGTFERRLTRREVGRLPCSEQAKAVILKATGPRAHRYSEVSLMREELEGRRPIRINSLDGKRVAITGLLSMPRAAAIVRIQQSGGQYQDKVRSNTDVVLTGRVSPTYAGRRRTGKKLKRAMSLSRHGHPVVTISEEDFMSLTRRPPQPGRRTTRVRQ
jgi:serine/threonine protein kinase